MQLRTDLALERQELCGAVDGVVRRVERRGGVTVTQIRVCSAAAARAIGKPPGVYVTLEIPALTDAGGTLDDAHAALVRALAMLLPKRGTVLVVGLGNPAITPDALGPKTADKVLATRHISRELARSVGLSGLRSAAVFRPGVLGQTGVETRELIRGVVQRVRPAAVLAIDALASRSLRRLGCTVQLADSGISPGSGVGNARSELSPASLGVPVVSLGVPTVVDAATLAQDLLSAQSPPPAVEPEGRQMMVTPREIDLLIDRAAALLSHAVNCALHPAVPPEILRALV